MNQDLHHPPNWFSEEWNRQWNHRSGSVREGEDQCLKKMELSIWNQQSGAMGEGFEKTYRRSNAQSLRLLARHHAHSVIRSTLRLIVSSDSQRRIRFRSNSRCMRHRLTINGYALRPYNSRRFCAILYMSIHIRPIASQISIFASFLCDSIYKYTVYDRLLLFCAILFASLVPIPEAERQRRFFWAIHRITVRSSTSIFPPGNVTV
ncbi:hypothetical protein L6452_03228 [Arctium lappa]|uniref:Uncharacterized protein n=1 Tax=Arctium lappa TaxID=4217 RepID=A0ACB9FLR3_ARCLA|nr:hypothetical protein L6452_03228 [Arctium lappa]